MHLVFLHHSCALSVVRVGSGVRTEVANRLRDFTWNLGTLEEGYGT